MRKKHWIMHVQTKPLKSGNTQRGFLPPSSSATSVSPLLSVSIRFANHYEETCLLKENERELEREAALPPYPD